MLWGEKRGKWKSRESNPGHLWLEPPVLSHWAMTAGWPPPLTILYTLQVNFWCLFNVVMRLRLSTRDFNRTILVFWWAVLNRVEMYNETHFGLISEARWIISSVTSSELCPTAPAFYTLEYWYLFSEGLCKGYSTDGGDKDTQRDGYKAGTFAQYQNGSTTVHKLHSTYISTHTGPFTCPTIKEQSMTTVKKSHGLHVTKPPTAQKRFVPILYQINTQQYVQYIKLYFSLVYNNSS